MSFTQQKRAFIIAHSYAFWDLQEKKVLDVGCGNGVVSSVLKKRFDLNLWGTDVVDYCKTEIPFTKMEQKEKLPFPDDSFDYVMFNDTLHHTESPKELLLEGMRVASGIFIFEDHESLILRIADVSINYFYSSKMQCPLNFRTYNQWVSLFEELDFAWEKGRVVCPWWYPFRHMVFKVRKRKTCFT